MDGAPPMTPVLVLSLHTLHRDMPEKMHALEAGACPHSTYRVATRANFKAPPDHL